MADAEAGGVAGGVEVVAVEGDRVVVGHEHVCRCSTVARPASALLRPCTRKQRHRRFKAVTVFCVDTGRARHGWRCTRPEAYAMAHREGHASVTHIRLAAVPSLPSCRVPWPSHTAGSVPDSRLIRPGTASLVGLPPTALVLRGPGSGDGACHVGVSVHVAVPARLGVSPLSRVELFNVKRTNPYSSRDVNI